jgi:hypothetical protein
MALNCKNKHPLQYDGTSQDQRFLDALEPGSAKIHECSLRDWMRFAYDYAAHLNYFSINDDTKPDGNWQVFVKAESEIEAYLKDAALVDGEDWIPADEREKILKREPQANYEPHLALFLSFLKLMKFPQEQINGFTKRHLDFYYTEVLQLSKQPALPDRVHLIFELAKNATEDIVPENSLVDAGKDANGKPMRYATSEEIAVNTAQVAQLKSIFHKAGSVVRYAEKTNSSDGLGTEFKEDNPKWQALGDDNWPAAHLGFALASSVLLLKEGTRKITVSLSLSFQDTKSLPQKKQLESQLMIFLTGEKDWVQPSKIEVTTVPTSTSGKIEFTLTIDAAEKAIVPYDVKIHKERLNTNLPVLRVLVNTGNSDGYSVYAALTKAVIKNASINVEVTGAKDLTLENDNGKLDPSKPFFPFGPVPGKKSNFFVGSSEIFQKEWQYVKLNVTWKSKPDSLKDYYKAYDDSFVNKGASDYNLTTTQSASNPVVTGEDYFTFSWRYIKNNMWYPEDGGPEQNLFDNPIMIDRDSSDSSVVQAPVISPVLMHKGIDVNKAVLQNYLTPQTATVPGVTPPPSKPISARFETAKFNPGFRSPLVSTADFSPSTKSNFLRLTLKNDFLHEAYPRLLALAMVAKTKTGAPADLLMPHSPYSPVISAITFDYKASATNSFAFSSSDTPQTKLDNFTARSIQLFHENPFGQSEQHVFLKEQCGFIDPTSKRDIALVPEYTPEGEFYIGLKNGEPLSIVNLLVQVVEGSEDPLAPTFTGDQKTQWFALSNNEWKALNKDFIVGDTTNNLLRAGIVKITLPPEINDSNTLLDAGLFWLKMQLPDGLTSHSICKLTDVLAQAIEAVFQDNSNELSHLETALPAKTISKFIDKPPLVKGLAQPFASFGGVQTEDDQSFYIRVSERLRHKQRAINIWDYERLVLQKFPSVYKVKCLNHTSILDETGKPDYFELSPGFVSLIVIPDIRNKNSFDPLQPRASQNLLREIEDFINPLHSLHVKFDADNPEYETVFLDFRVKFYDQFDANAYAKKLNDDLVKYLSPWAYGEFSNIHFGGSLYKSVVIRFIEELPYVDFISHFKMYQRIGKDDKNVKDLSLITASTARSILVSAAKHNIGLISKDKVCDE